VADGSVPIGRRFGFGLDEISKSVKQKLKMKKARRKKRGVGRPRTTGPGTLVGIRCHKEFLKRVDDWQARKAPVLSRPQAIMQLAEIGLDKEAR
jgi:hypothetical protein